MKAFIHSFGRIFRGLRLRRRGNSFNMHLNHKISVMQNDITSIKMCMNALVKDVEKLDDKISR